jgi:hypothetical protein
MRGIAPPVFPRSESAWRTHPVRNTSELRCKDDADERTRARVPVSGLTRRTSDAGDGAEERTRTFTPLRARAPQAARHWGRSHPTSVTRDRPSRTMADLGRPWPHVPDFVARALHPAYPPGPPGAWASSVRLATAMLFAHATTRIMSWYSWSWSSSRSVSPVTQC